MHLDVILCATRLPVSDSKHTSLSSQLHFLMDRFENNTITVRASNGHKTLPDAANII